MADEESKPLPPGTVRLVDSSSQSDLDSKSDLILVPAPSEDPRTRSLEPTAQDAGD
ncbi:hypothetical protein MCOR02_012424 [Pyricularia oryzae]|nr:hypothetical protein MCOR02_012424 [Pyricularia oryzae]